MLLIPILIFFSISYFVLIFVLTWGVIRTELYYCDTVSNKTSVSIIVAVRNEAKNINNLILSIQKQIYPNNLFEVIFVNDHSTDNTEQIIKNQNIENFILLNLDETEFGKKQAIKKAIDIAKGEIIVTTDGDCSMNENWLTTIVSFYEQKNSDMILAPVLLKKRTSFLGFFQFYDFLSLMSSTIGASKINKPIMCNGANLIYKKNVYQELINPTKNSIASGDDMFLMINLKKNKKKIHFLNSFEALVTTKSETSIIDFVNQRIRWAGKNTKHSDVDIFLVGLIVYLFNFSILTTGVLSIWNFEFFIYFFQILFVKTFIEFIFISLTASTFNQKIRLIIFFFIQPFHIIYTVLIPILSLIFPYKWKERNLKM